MKMTTKLRVLSLLIVVISAGTLFGCAGYEANNKRGNIPGMYIRSEMQDADRATEAARQAGKDKECPVEFKAAEDAKNNAYDVFRSCRTEEGVALAKKATEKAKTLCPQREPAKVVPAPAPIPVVAPVPAQPADTDGDGVIDSLDKCPGTPSGVAVDKDGCPLESWVSLAGATGRYPHRNQGRHVWLSGSYCSSAEGRTCQNVQPDTSRHQIRYQ